MKKLISAILALSMLTVPIYAQEDYTQEQLVEQAKTACQISDKYTEFEIASVYDKNGISLYNMVWSDNENKNSIEALIGSDGIVYRYYNYEDNVKSKSKVYTDAEAKKTADSFLKAALKEKYDNIEYMSCSNYSDIYSFSYKPLLKGITCSNAEIKIGVNKYNNKITHYSYPTEIIQIKITDFNNTKSIDDAEKIMKENIQLGYKTYYDYTAKKYEVKPLYRMKDYLLKAADLTPLTSEDVYSYGSTKEAEASDMAGGGRALTPAEIKGIEDMKNTLSIDDALKIYNSVFEDNITSLQVTASYQKEFNSDNYRITLTSNDDENYFSFTADTKGRLVSYHCDRDYENSENKISEKDAKNTAESLINKLNSEYSLTPLEGEYRYDNYIFSCNLMRNDIISFDESIYINLDNNGKITSVNTTYYPDEIFTDLTKGNISPENAFNSAKDKYGFKPYYNIKTNYSKSSDTYEAIPVYGFADKFTINAVTGEFLDLYGNNPDNDTIKSYTDLSDQWYAEEARLLSYMGYSFDSDEFKGDELLTYGALKELNKGNYFGSVDLSKKNEEDTMTRYEFCEYLIDNLGLKNAVKYNEIFIKPFEDADYRYTGTIAVLKAMGVVRGDSFRGNDKITRGEAVVMIYRCFTAE